jgi:hypothetical protein
MTKCKIVTVVMGDLEKCTDDILLSIENKLPIILVPGSPLSDSLIMAVKKKQGINEEDNNNGEEDEEVRARKMNNLIKLPEELLEAIGSEDAHLYIMEDNNSEDIAALLHFFLTVTPY